MQLFILSVAFMHGVITNYELRTTNYELERSDFTYGLTERAKEDLIVVLDQLDAIAHKWYAQENGEKLNQRVQMQ